MKAVQLQYVLALVFLALGVWCIVQPVAVEQFIFRPDYLTLNASSQLLIVYLGAQTMFCGVLLLLCRLSANGFLCLALLVALPFFALTYYYFFVAEMLTDWMLLDLVGCIVMFILALSGHRLAKKEANLLQYGGF